MLERRKIVFYELNEVPWRIFDHFARLRPGSHVGRLRRDAAAYETVAEDVGHLSPWVTWPTLHRGVTNADHRISDFGQDLAAVDREFPPLWQILAGHGVRMGVFGTLHTYPMPADLGGYDYFVPDTFAAGPECFPADLETFQRFNLAMVAKSGRQVEGGIALKEAGRFLAAAPRLGLRGRTLMQIARQLGAERVNPNRVVRRRTSQVQIAFDFFMAALERSRPDMTMFFTNHVASSMHRYWPALFPEDFPDLAYDTAWLEDWSGEIPFVMTEADHQLGRLLRFVEADPDYVLCVATSMGQAAVQGRKPLERELTLKDPRRLARAVGAGAAEIRMRPAMAPQFVFEMVESAADAFVQGLGGLSVNGRPVPVTRLGPDRVRVDFGFENLADDEIAIELRGERVGPDAIGAVNLNLRDAAGANAYHIPEGMLMVYDPKAPAPPDAPRPRRISTTEVAPSILANFGVPRPGYMQAPLPL